MLPPAPSPFPRPCLPSATLHWGGKFIIAFNSRPVVAVTGGCRLPRFGKDGPLPAPACFSPSPGPAGGEGLRAATAPAPAPEGTSFPGLRLPSPRPFIPVPTPREPENPSSCQGGSWAPTLITSQTGPGVQRAPEATQPGQGARQTRQRTTWSPELEMPLRGRARQEEEGPGVLGPSGLLQQTLPCSQPHRALSPQRRTPPPPPAPPPPPPVLDPSLQENLLSRKPDLCGR